MAQIDIKLGDKEKNIETAGRMLCEAGNCGSDVIIFPELWSSGYQLSELHRLAEPEDGPILKWLCEEARKNHMYIVTGSLPEASMDGIYNTSYLIDASGAIRGKYRKIHLFPLMGEEGYFKSGETPALLKMERGGRTVKAGLMICYDLRFPELARTLALRGAELLFIPAEFPHPRKDHWRVLLMARAIENQLFVVAANRVGSDGRNEFFGSSMIIDPWGRVVAEGGEDEGLITADIDLGLIDEVRERIPCYRNLRLINSMMTL